MCQCPVTPLSYLGVQLILFSLLANLKLYSLEMTIIWSVKCEEIMKNVHLKWDIQGDVFKC